MRHLGTSGNKDGMGIMYVENGRVKVEKKLAKSDSEVIDLYGKHKHRACAVHQRNQTKGAVNDDNVHPFMVTSIDEGDKYDIWMMHNGTIHDIQVEGSRADSYNFATHFLRGFLKEFPDAVTSFHFGRIISGLIPKSKFVFLSASGDPKDKGKFTIINSGEGRMLQPGIWISRKETVTPTKAYTPPFHNHSPIGFRPPSASVVPVGQPALPLPAPASTAASHTGQHTPINVGAWVMQPDGLKVFRVADSPEPEVKVEVEMPVTEASPDILTDDSDEELDFDISVIGSMSNREIELIVEGEPSFAAKLIRRLASVF